MGVGSGSGEWECGWFCLSLCLDFWERVFLDRDQKARSAKSWYWSLFWKAHRKIKIWLWYFKSPNVWKSPLIFKIRLNLKKVTWLRKSCERRSLKRATNHTHKKSQPILKNLLNDWKTLISKKLHLDRDFEKFWSWSWK